jgi:hypothetical protein
MRRFVMFRKGICLAILIGILGFGVTAQAQLLIPPITNPGFEATDLGAGGTGQWVDYAEDWIINAQGNCYLEDGSWQIVAAEGVATLKMWDGAAIWQQIGTWTPNTDYEIGLWVGRGLDTSAVLVELWAGGSPAQVPDSGFGTIDGSVGATLIGGGPLVPTVAVGENEEMSLVLNTGASFNSDDALWLRVVSTGEAAWVDDIGVVSLRDPALAHHPTPASGLTDVLREGALSWTSGLFVQKHDVYFGSSLENVTNASRANPLDVLVSEGQDADHYDVGRLEFGQTYFWRVDEVNGAPDRTVFRGDIWEFTVEPFAYPLQSVTATASSSGADNTGPEKTVDGSGLNDQDQHSIDAPDMWLSAGEPDPWIQYEFVKAYKLHEMWAWNSNQLIEAFVGFGAKDVTIEASVDGIEWAALTGPIQFNQGSGKKDYTANTIVGFSGVMAKYVRITVHAGWGMVPQAGLSEVRFFYIPMSARQPNPDIGATEVAVDATLDWRPGREALEHKVYLSTDQQAVIDGSAPVSSTGQMSFSPTLAFGSTYFWRVDEVNEAEVMANWPGDVWSFSTQAYRVVDDFESYNDVPEGEAGSHLVYVIWQDGYANPSTNGSTMGYLTESSLETTNVHGGSKSIPLFYDNTTASISEVTANTHDLFIGSNWAIGSPQGLVLWLRGDSDNNSTTDRLYVKLGNTKVTYDGDISLAQWSLWSIDLAALGLDLSNVSTISIGLERTGGSGHKGVVLLDDIRLYGVAPGATLQPDPESNLTTNPSLESPDFGAPGTEQWADKVDDWIIDTQGSSYLEDGTWDIVAADGVATLKMWHGAAIWQQIGNVVPNTDYDISLFIGRGYDASAVQVELWAGGDPTLLPDSYGILADTVGATLIGGASLTPSIAVGQNELMGLSINTGANFGPGDALWIRIESIGGDGTAAWVDNVMVAKP